MPSLRSDKKVAAKEVCLIIHPYTAKKDVGAGHDRYAYELMRHLKGYKDLPTTTFDSGDLSTLPSVAWAELRAITQLMFSRERRILHATASANAQCAISAGRGPLITTIHDVLWFQVGSRYDTKLKYQLKARAIKRAAQKSDRLIVPFASTRDFLVNELQIAPDKIRLIPYGVDHDAFYPLADGFVERPAALDAAYKNVLFVGAINFGKGIDTLIKAFPDVVRQVPNARLIIGSKGWDTPLVKKLYEQSPVKERIVFAGFIPEEDLRAFYLYADVTCFPSRYGFGLPTLESMACGTPTVSGRTLDAPEFVEDAGLLVDPESPAELSQALGAALTDDELRQRLITKGLAKAKQYSWARNAEQTAAVYKEFFA